MIWVDKGTVTEHPCKNGVGVYCRVVIDTEEERQRVMKEARWVMGPLTSVSGWTYFLTGQPGVRRLRRSGFVVRQVTATQLYEKMTGEQL